MFFSDILTVEIKIILAPLIDCHDPGRTGSGKPYVHSCSFNDGEQISIDVSFNTFYSKAKTN